MPNCFKIISFLLAISLLGFVSPAPAGAQAPTMPASPEASADTSASVQQAPAQTQAPAAQDPSKPVIRNFSFIHISDSHVEPYLKTPTDDQLAGARSFKVVQGIRSLGKVALAPYGITAPKPGFIIHTGDLGEFGLTSATWDAVAKYFHNLGMAVAYCPGNHDNTWVSTPNRWRAMFGGLNYSFDAADCHFIMISTPTLQDPLPSIGEEAVEFVRKDLAKVGPQKPVFVAFHHPLMSSEFASNYDCDRLLDELRPYNVVLLLFGHGHNADKTQYGGIDAVQGGSPFDNGNKAERIGYSIVYVAGNSLFVAYKRADQTSASKALLAKAIPPQANYPAITITSPAKHQAVTADQLQIEATIDAKQILVSEASYDIDDDAALKGKLLYAAQRASGNLNTRQLTPGAHFMRINFKGPNNTVFYKTVPFYIEHNDASQLATAKWRFHMGGGSKCAPLVYNGRVYVGANDGNLYALDEATGKLVWQVAAGGEIMTQPVVYKDTILFGTGGGAFYAVTTDGKAKWSFPAGDAVFSSPVLDETGTVYFGTNGAKFFALNAETGQMKWSFDKASYSIESKPCVAGDRVYFGAWDGNLYCLDKKNGQQIWAKPGPYCQKKFSRYYAPADNGPIATGDMVFITDRGYKAGAYKADGSYVNDIASGCSALGLGADGKSLYVRSTGAGLSKIDFSGKKLWTSAATGGGFAISPLEVGGVVYTCSNRGNLQAVDPASGAVKWTYQVSPKLYVMGGVSVNNGVAYVCCMDGTVSAIQGKAGAAAAPAAAPAATAAATAPAAQF